jgi:predicted nucleotidyltransferase component of viral defense system
MNQAIVEMLQRYNCKTISDYKNALQEMMQQIALLGLWRAKFYEHAAFYGGTALRILYDLDRFSEDLDFSLLRPHKNFSLDIYVKAIEEELRSFGFLVAVEPKVKTIDSAIQSAFIKANTVENFISIDVDVKTRKHIHLKNLIRIKLEIDTDPPPGFATDVRFVLWPIPFSVKTYSQPDLLAGKLHAVLCRSWQTRVKGRDWYDLVWYIARKIPVHLAHLETRMRQSGHYDHVKPLSSSNLVALLKQKISTLDIDQARADVIVFLKDPQATDIWSHEFFNALVDRLEFI